MRNYGGKYDDYEEVSQEPACKNYSDERCNAKRFFLRVCEFTLFSHGISILPFL
jgi:hypothetical protein